MPFYLRILPKWESSARNAGFMQEDWRAQIVDDLLTEDQLELIVLDPIEQPRYRIFGHQYSAIAVPDNRRTDSLFIVGLFDGPACGTRIPTGAVLLPGPWKALPDYAGGEQNTFPVQEHIEAFLRNRPETFEEGGRQYPQRKSNSGLGTLGDALKGFSLPIDSPTPPPVEPTPPPVEPTPPPAEPAPPPAELTPPQVEQTPPPAEPISGQPILPPIKQVHPTSKPESGWEAGVEKDSRPTESANAPASPILKQGLVRRAPEHLRGILSSDNPSRALQETHATLTSQLRIIREQLDQLPSISDLKSLVDRFDDAARLAGHHEVTLADNGDELPSLDTTLGLLQAMSAGKWNVLPTWVAPRGAAASDLLNSRSSAVELEEVLAWVDAEFGDSPPKVLTELLPEEGTRLLDRIQRALRHHELTEGLKKRIAPLTFHSVLENVSVGEAEAIIERLDELRERLHKDALTGLWQLLPEKGFTSWLQISSPERFSNLPDMVVSSVADWAALEQLLSHVRSKPTTPLPTERPRPTQTAAEADGLDESLLGFAHPMTDERGTIRAAVVSVVLPEGSQQIGTVQLGVRVRSSRPLTGEAVLFARTTHLQTMPEQQISDDVAIIKDPLKESVRCLQMSMSLTKEHWDEGSSGLWYLDLVLPLVGYRVSFERITQKGEIRVRLEFQHLDLACDGYLTFTRFRAEVPPIAVPQEDNTDLEFMKAAPLGVQPGYEKLEPMVRQATKSFLVSAPRRFGKTTLLRYLEAVARENEKSAVFRITLNRNESPINSMENVLRHLKDELFDRYEISATFPLGVDGLLQAKTFRAARRRLAERGFENLVIMVDEAQSLVPRSDGGTWGTHLKDLIEGDLAQPKAGRFARVCVVLVGTPQLPRRLGTNCHNFMNVMAERTSFGEAELAAFTRKLTKDQLESTAAGRERLARTANNLYTLKMLLVEVANILSKEGRTFFLSRDVERATRRLLDRDRDGIIGLWDYVAAELSHTDTWDPVDAYPVALALTSQEMAEASIADVGSAVMGWLDGQLAECQIQATVTEERVQDSIRELTRLGILSEDGIFKRPLLETLLGRRALRRPFQHNLDQIALARLAVDVIAWDTRAKPRSVGGQASVYVLESEEVSQAWRVCILSTENERRRFVRTCAAIRVLRDTRTRLSGDAHLPRLRSAGFDLDDPRRGIMIYDWIEGDAFSRIWERSSAMTRAMVVRQVARALDALGARGVVHRDVHPRNILVDTELHAVLIDFGMACLTEDSTYSTVAEPGFLAPELVQGSQPTTASDVYALGRILKGNGDDVGGGELKDLILRMMHKSPADRPSPGQIAAQLKRIIEAETVTKTLELARNKVDDLLEGTLDKEWLLEILSEYHGSATFQFSGLQAWCRSAALEAAACLNGVFEAWLKNEDDGEAHQLFDLEWPGRSPSLAAVANIGLSQSQFAHWATTEVAAVGALRIAAAHPSDRTAQLERARRHDPNREPLVVYHQAISRVAKLMDDRIACQGTLASFVQVLTGDVSS